MISAPDTFFAKVVLSAVLLTGAAWLTWEFRQELVHPGPDGVSALTLAFDKNEYRVFFYIEREQVVVVHSTMVLVHGIHKKTQKTPAGTLRSLSVG